MVLGGNMLRYPFAVPGNFQYRFREGRTFHLAILISLCKFRFAPCFFRTYPDREMKKIFDIIISHQHIIVHYGSRFFYD